VPPERAQVVVQAEPSLLVERLHLAAVGRPAQHGVVVDTDVRRRVAPGAGFTLGALDDAEEHRDVAQDSELVDLLGPEVGGVGLGLIGVDPARQVAHGGGEGDSGPALPCRLSGLQDGDRLFR
jgi:hypothetical protein